MDEKRRAPRHTVWFPMQLSTGGDVIMAISRNMSEVGVMMVTAASLDVGSPVTLNVALPNDAEGARELVGKIVRVEENEDDREGLWRHKVAVDFDARVNGLNEVLENVERSSHPPSA
jgi:hypothetical protein